MLAMLPEIRAIYLQEPFPERETGSWREASHLVRIQKIT